MGLGFRVQLVMVGVVARAVLSGGVVIFGSKDPMNRVVGPKYPKPYYLGPWTLIPKP